MTLFMGDNIYVPFSIPQTELLAGTVIEAVSPVDGYINEALVAVQTAVTVGGVLTFKAGTTDVDGLTVTVASAAAKGTTYTDKATDKHPSRKVTKGQRIQIIPSAAFDTAGALNGLLRINTGM